MVKKTNKRFKVQDRALVLTDKAIYNLKPLPKPTKQGLRYEVQRRIDISKLGTIFLSRLCDDYMVLQIPSEYDYVFETPKKTVFIILLQKHLRRNHLTEKEVKVVESISYKVRQGKQKMINFVKDENVPVSLSRKSRDGIEVKIRSGVNSTI